MRTGTFVFPFARTRHFRIEPSSKDVWCFEMNEFLKPELLLIETDREIRRCLRTAFCAEHYRFREATSASRGMKQFDMLQPDAIVLDLDVSGGNRIDVIRRFRQHNLHVPLIVLSSQSAEQDKITALDAGADDFVTKPFLVGEFLARIRAILRRPNASTDAVTPVFRSGDIEVDFTKRLVQLAGEEVHLTRTEFKLLHTLIRHANRTVSHGQLLTEVWGPDAEGRLDDLRVYVLQLRKKLEHDPARPRYLQTTPGIGYRLITQNSAAIV
jgi:two-component system KDP operon response regulator KdpE